MTLTFSGHPMMGILCALILLLGIAAAENFFTGDERDHREKFDRFKIEHSKVYKLDEEEERFGVFKATLKLIDERNVLQVASGGEEVHGVTKFADWTQEEFNRLNGIKISDGMDDIYKALGKRPDETVINDVMVESAGAKALKRRRLSEDFYSCADPPKEHANWIGKLSTSVKNQAQCGSCWAFAAVEQIESDLIRDHGVKLELAPTQLVQCDPFDSGCNGGILENAFEYIKAVGGLSLESAYPYDAEVSSGKTGFCRPNVANGVATVTHYSNFNDNSTHPGEDTSPACVEKDMANYMLREGPIALYVDASTWNTYTGGVLTTCGTKINHGVQAVGLNMEADVPYWIVRNSWGGDWGLNGYLYIKYGEDLCRITSNPLITLTSLTNVVDAF